MLSPHAKRTITSNEKIKCLFDLGDAGQGQDWRDYLQYGFDRSDVPALLELVADEAFNDTSAESNEVWVPVHAWRALGQIGDDRAVAPLITLFDRFADDDCALDDLPRVMGMIGKPAIAPLGRYLTAFQHDPYARTIAAEGLAEIARCDPECRGQVIGCYRDYMADPDLFARTFNAVLICKLVELSATETIDDIRRLFGTGCVDITCSGDLEAVEIGLGLRTERSTPSAHAANLLGLDTLPEPETRDRDDSHGFIDFCLARHGNDDAVLDVSELHGFLTALACAPTPVVPARWLPAIWGDRDSAPAWEAREESEAFSQAVTALYNSVLHGLNTNTFKPLFQAHETGDETYFDAESWCEGFLRGLKLWGPQASSDTAFTKTCTQSIRLFATDAGFERLVTMSEDEVVARQHAIEADVLRLFQHFSKRPEPVSQTVVRDVPKIGRNDPCPCGSGRKFKKCCLRK